MSLLYQLHQLKQYYNCNLLLVYLNQFPNVSPTVRQEIEDTLLLPIAESKKKSRCIDNYM
ncbi:NACHT C-terminal helical domain 2-containing protein [Coleofasciculus sp. C1-SOL-03]|uniref:NACHT C-terminal helical domain 2-containing protein n=1 Tax=Coleofasciculus sp. C1-SOL-03 TaxID=3069522 RepID=UPI004063EE19